jgi:hypothetical protein
MSFNTCPVRTGSREITRLRSFAEALGSLQVSRTLIMVVDRLGILAM